MEFCELECTLSIETLTSTGHVSQRKSLQSCMLTLGRDQFKDMVIRIESKSAKQQAVTLKNVKLFKKFVREGKATIKTQEKTQVLISNCPPDRLAVFLKVLEIKIGIRKSHASDKTKLYSNLPKEFQFISPLTEKDVISCKENAGKGQAQMQTSSVSAKGTSRHNFSDLTPKRKRADDSLTLPRKRISALNNKENATQTPDEKGIKKSNLSKEQRDILDAVVQGKNIFFTGSAGTGKSHLLKRIIGALPPVSTVAAASTGVAACHIGGVTLHSFAGIGSGDANIETCYELAKRPTVKQQWHKCKHLIIDEISMVESGYFDKIEAVARHMKKSDRPFGGIQLIICGDFLQLPPVIKDPKVKNKFCFQAASWAKCIQATFELTEVRRQTDAEFINLLQHIRVGKCPDHIFERLKNSSSHAIEHFGVQATKLCTHKEDVIQMNRLRMDSLKGDVKVYMASDSDSHYTAQMDKHLPAGQRLELKVGAQVMLTKNLDVQRGLVNGARGIVSRFENTPANNPVVRFIHGAEIKMKMERFVFPIRGGGLVTRVQYPIKLAWAISIHKSQGLTLDCVEVSLARVFEDGQAYVALSRAKSLEGLRVLDFNRQSIRAHPDVLRFYIRLRRNIRLNRQVDQENVKFVIE